MKRAERLERASGITRFFQQIMRHFLANYAQKSGIMRELCESRNIFERKFLMFQFIKLVNQVSQST